MKGVKRLSVILGCWLIWSLPASAMQIVVSVPPLAGLIAPLLEPEDTLEVLLKPGVSPHGFQLKPSDLLQLHRSDLVVSAGTPVDAWLDPSLKHIDVASVRMNLLAGIERLPTRRGGRWESHEEEGHGTHDHDADSQGRHQDYYMDGHLWLSYPNARRLIKALAETLQNLEPGRAQRVAEKRDRWLARLHEVDQQLKARLSPFRENGFIVLHDAYHYFEKRYQLNGQGSIRLNPEVAPSLKRIAELRNLIESRQIDCVFKEPQFPQKRVLAVIRGLDVRVGSLDPMGVYESDGHIVKSGFKPYDRLMLDMGNAFMACLAGKERQ